MNNPKLPVTSTAENHLTVDEMYQYLENQLPAANRHQIEQHLLDCELCHDALAGLSLTTKEKTNRQLFEINYQLKNRTTRRKPNSIMLHLKNWGVTSIILFIILIAALIVWYQVKQSSGTKKVKPKAAVTQTVSVAPVSENNFNQNYLVGHYAALPNLPQTNSGVLVRL